MISSRSKTMRLASVARLPLIMASWSNSALDLRKHTGQRNITHHVVIVAAIAVVANCTNSRKSFPDFLTFNWPLFRVIDKVTTCKRMLTVNCLNMIGQRGISLFFASKHVSFLQISDCQQSLQPDAMLIYSYELNTNGINQHSVMVSCVSRPL